METASTDTEIGSDGGGEKVEEGEESVAEEPRRLTKLEKLVGGASLQDKVFGTDLVTYMKQHPKYPVPLVAEQTILYLNQHGTEKRRERCCGRGGGVVVSGGDSAQYLSHHTLHM